jgi:pimeloyl-ACP methyl ester carboxylesterase
MRGPRRLAWAAMAVCPFIAAIAPAAGARQGPPVPTLDWQPCGKAPNVACATATVPLDYDHPSGPTVELHLAKSPATDPAHRIGSLFINFGGPGGTAAAIFEAQGQAYRPALNQRFDIVAMDPRGVGQSSPAIDCKANQKTDGIYSQPVTTPYNLDAHALVAKDQRYITRCVALNHGILAHVSTANVARDIDLLRRSLGERKITYFGYSYGTFLGATYASMFPRSYRAMVLDGPVDANAYINHPLRDLSAQTDGLERAFGRFMQACAADRAACRNFPASGSDPWEAYDALIEKLTHTPLPVGADKLDGVDATTGTSAALYSKTLWPALAEGLAKAERGDGALLKALSDGFYGDNRNGTFDPSGDRYFTISAGEQEYPRGLRTYVSAGQGSWDEHEHFWWNNGYVELNYGLYPVHDRDAFNGPFRVPDSAVTPLVVGTTYDPATPYRGAKNLVRSLGNARLLTMLGDGHTAYRNKPVNSQCINSHVKAYLTRGTLPAAGTQCRQELGFTAPAAVQAFEAPQISQLPPHVPVP